MHPLFRLHLLCFPPACRLCRLIMNPLARAAPGYPYLCEPCHVGLPWKSPRYSCRACGSLTGEVDRERCPRCAARDHALTRTWSAFSYDEPVRRWVWNLKYRREEAVAGMLGEMLRQAPNALREPDAHDLILPVPLHRRRLRQRGFNQAYLLAHAWSRSLKAAGAPAPTISTGLLQRHRHTLPQVGLSPEHRGANVDAAFSIVPGALSPRKGPEAELEGKRVLLVDDLMTTGATLNACASTLREAGARQVDAMVLARA